MFCGASFIINALREYTKLKKLIDFYLWPWYYNIYIILITLTWTCITASRDANVVICPIFLSFKREWVIAN